MVLIGGGSGTGGGAAAAPGTVTVDTITALRAATEAALGTDYVEVLGHTAVGDGGGGSFRLTGTGADSNDDDNGVVIVSTAMEQWERVGFKYAGEINVNWFGIFPDATDKSTELADLITFHPDSPLYFPQGAPNTRYDLSIDVNEDPDRAAQEINLQKGNRSAGQASNWEYAPKWRGDAPTGEPEESGTIISVADASGKGYAIRGCRRVADPQVWAHGHFSDIKFWGDTGDQSGVIIDLEDVGHFTKFTNCSWRYCDAGIRLRGVFGCEFETCKIGDRNNQGLNVGVWCEATATSYSGWHTYRNTTICTDKVGILSNNRANGNPSIGDRIESCELENNQGLAYWGIHVGYNWNPTLFETNYMEGINSGGLLLDLTNFGLGSLQTNVGEGFRFTGRGTIEFRDVNTLIVMERDKSATGFSGTDLVIDGADNTKVTSASHTSVSTEVGDAFEITAGTGFTVGSYQVKSIDGTGYILTAAAGTVGSTGGTWNMAQDSDGPRVRIEHNRYPDEHVHDSDSELIIDTNHVFGSNGGVENDEALRVYQINETIDQHACSRMLGHFTNPEPKFTNGFVQHDLSQFEFWVSGAGGGAGTVTKTTEDTPFGQPALEVVLPAGGTEEIRITGPVGGINYMSSEQALTSYHAFTFAIRAVTTPTVEVGLRNSRRSSAFQQTIKLEDSSWHSYCIVANKGDSSWHYFLRNPDASNPITIRLGDIQAVRSSDRRSLREFLDTRCFAIAVDANDTNNSGLYFNGDSIIDARRDFGIVGDGTDETVKLQACLDAASTGDVSKVQLPTGDINITSTIAISGMRGVTIEGAGKIGGSFAAPWTEANMGGTKITWGGGAAPMFDIDAARYFTFRDMHFCNTALDGTGTAATICLDMPDSVSHGNGHFELNNVSFQLKGAGIAVSAGTVEGDNNCADFHFTECVFSGDSAARTEFGLVVNNLQGVNYSFHNCLFAYLDTAVTFNEGGCCTMNKCDGFELLTLIKQVDSGKNIGTHQIFGGRFDANVTTVPLTLFDGSTGNAEPKIFKASGVTVTARDVNENTVAPLIMAKDQTYAYLDSCQFTDVPLVRFFKSSKTGITPKVICKNCDITATASDTGIYVDTSGTDSVGHLVQIDKDNPGLGYVSLESCTNLQQPIDDWQMGVSSHTYVDSEDFNQWLVAKYSPTGLWMFDEASGTTVTDYGSGGNDLTVDSGTLGLVSGGVPHRTGINWQADDTGGPRTTDGWVTTGLTLSMSDTDYTFVMLLEKNAPFYDGDYDAIDSQIYAVITNEVTPDTENTDSYASFPYIPSVTSASLQILDHNGSGGPTGYEIDQINHGGWFALVLTWDFATNAVDAFINGQHVEGAINSYPATRANWDLSGSSTLHLGGWRPSGEVSRQWEGKAGVFAVIPSKLTELQAVEVCGRLTATRRQDYARATTP